MDISFFDHASILNLYQLSKERMEIKFKLPRLTICLIIIKWLILCLWHDENVLIQHYSIEID